MSKLTVLMSVYNGEKFIRDAIDSVLRQTFTDFEFIIYEDASTDNTLEIIESYRDTRIKLIKNAENRGLTQNLHDGMNLASGEYLARMDADDICLPDRFQKQIDFLKNNNNISILGSAVIFFDKTGKEILGKQPLTHDEIKVKLLLSYTMLHPSVMMRLEDMRKHGLNYNPHFRYSQDFDLWVRASRLLKLANLDEPLIKMREHQFKISRALKPAQKAFSDEIRYNQHYHLKLKFNPKQKEILNNVASGFFLNEKTDLRILEDCFLKIILSNEVINYYDQNILLKRIKLTVFSQYYNCLSNRNINGIQFWTSLFNLFRSLSLKFKLSIVIRSLLTLIKPISY